MNGIQLRLRLLAALIGLLSPCLLFAQSNPIVFVTQVPQPHDFANIVSSFGNHQATMSAAPRGGDLWVRYPDGTLKNLTEAAGYGEQGFQRENSIAVRDPAVSWDGTQVLFSMVVGAPLQYDYNDYRFQLYEISGLGKNDTPIISKVPNQPTTYNNVMGTYAPDDDIIFASDRPRGGEKHLYPQLDEYESTATTTGLWRLNPKTGALRLLDHSPSGDFHPTVDSFGRVIFTRWDHLQQDQQAEDGTYGAYNVQSEKEGASVLPGRKEVFPEPRSEARRKDPNVSLHTFNHFFPWMMNPDGTGLETLNHIGRHELLDYIEPSFTNYGELREFIADTDRIGINKYSVEHLFTIRESPTVSGLYWATNGREFYTHATGQIVTLSGSPTLNAKQMEVTPITHPTTAKPTESPHANHSGLYRNPLPLSDDGVLVVHTSETRVDTNTGSRKSPGSRYDFRIKRLEKSGKYWKATTSLTSGITKSVSYYDPDVLVSYSGELWELQPVELVARARAEAGEETIPGKETDVFTAESVSLSGFQQYLADLNLALIVIRNVRSRDEADTQQPFQFSIGSSGKNAVSALQFIQGDQVRGYTDFGSGRRVLPRFMQSILIPEELQGGIGTGSYRISSDGSVAAIVPAERALSWQLINDAGEPLVRERYWLTFQPGEVRTCFSCHGLNEQDQNGNGNPTNTPLALKKLLEWWKGASNRDIRNPDGFLHVPSSTALRLRVRRGKRKLRVQIPKGISLASFLGARIVVLTKKGKMVKEMTFPDKRKFSIRLLRKFRQKSLQMLMYSGSSMILKKSVRRLSR